MTDLRYSGSGNSFSTAFPLTKNNDTIYRPVLTGLYVGTAGDLVIDVNGDICTYKNYQGWIFVDVRRVMTATTAGDIIGHR